MPFWQVVSWAYAFSVRALGNNLVFAFVPGTNHQFCYLHSVLFHWQVVSGASATSAGAADAAPAATADATQTKLDIHLPEMKYTRWVCNLCPAHWQNCIILLVQSRRSATLLEQGPGESIKTLISKVFDIESPSILKHKLRYWYILWMPKSNLKNLQVWY